MLKEYVKNTDGVEPHGVEAALVNNSHTLSEDHDGLRNMYSSISPVVVYLLTG